MDGRTTDHRGRIVAAVWLVLAAALVLLSASADGTVLTDTAYLVVSVGAAVAAWTGVLRRPVGRSARWIAVTLTANAVGDVLWQLDTWISGSPPDVGLADIGYLASYVALGIALTAYARDEEAGPRARFHSVLDGAAVLVVSLLVVWQSSVQSTLTDSLPVLTKVVWGAYPLLDAVAIGLVVRGVVLQSRMGLSAVLLALGSAAWLSSDLGWLLLASADSVSGWLDGGWLVGAVVLALLPWVVEGEPRAVAESSDAVVGRWRMGLAFLPLLVPGAFEFDAWLEGTDIDPIPGLLATLLLTVLVIVRAQRLLTDSTRSRAEVRSLARRFEALAVNSSDAVVVVDPQGTLTSDSRSLAELLGQPGGTGSSLPQLLSSVGIDQTDVAAVLHRAQLSAGEPVELELRGGHPSGGRVWLGGRAVDLSGDPDVGGIVVSLYDITDRKQVEEELAHQAFYDGLTGLANRSLFLDYTEQALRLSGCSANPPIVLCLDL